MERPVYTPEPGDTCDDRLYAAYKELAWFYAAIARQAQEIERLEKSDSTLCKLIGQQGDDLVKLRADLAKAVDGLKEYGRCKPLCANVGGYGYCDCGYLAAIAGEGGAG